MLPRSIDEVHRKHFQTTQSSLNAINHYLQAFAVADNKAWVVQFVCHFFEVQVGILGPITSESSETTTNICMHLLV